MSAILTRFNPVVAQDLILHDFANSPELKVWN